MFDDGYDYFCRNFVSQFERNPSGEKQNHDIYCGCVDYLGKGASNLPVDGMDAAFPEHA